MITSIKNDTIKSILKLKQKKYREETSSFLIEGEHLVEEALKVNRITLLIKNENYTGNLGYEKELIVTSNVFNALAFSKTPQGIMAICCIKEIPLAYQTLSKVLILDGLQDPGNVGTLIRSALAFGFDAMILSNNCVDMYNNKVVQATQGAFFRLSIVKAELLKQMAILKANGFTIFGTSLIEKAIPLESIDFTNYSKIGVVLGNEGNGVSKEILEKTDYSIKIQISEQVESLNVAIAGSIIMYISN